jgi:hypothetical protein
LVMLITSVTKHLVDHLAGVIAPNSRTVNGFSCTAVGETTSRAVDQVVVAVGMSAGTTAEASLILRSVVHLVGVGAARPGPSMTMTRLASGLAWDNPGNVGEPEVKNVM